MDELAFADIQADMADLAAPVAFEKHCISGLQRAALNSLRRRAVHGGCRAGNQQVSFGLEQVNQETAAIKALLR